MTDKKTLVYNFWFGAAYGGILTAYALQEILKLSQCRPLLADIRNATVNLLSEKYNFTKNFWTKYFSISKNLNKFSNIVSQSKKIQTFITGSDQVLRPKYTSDLSQYLLDFVNQTSKKIAFSASFGIDKEQFIKENSQEIIEHMKNSLKSFDFISVREKSGVEICRDLFDIEAEWIIDPVFILDKSKYDELIENENKEILRSAQNDNNNYSDKVVAYVLDTNKEYKKAYKYLEKKYNKKVVETANSNISVESWLKSIRDCDLFITDSFHGMCFAMIFNKPFICLANKDRGRARFDSICEMLGVENQCIDTISEVMQKDCVFKVDYQRVNQRIEEERKRGLDFLKQALEAPVAKTQVKIESRIKYLENRVCELEKQNNLSYQFKKYLWEKWLVIYHCYLPTPIKNIIHLFWQMIKGKK